MSLSEKQNLRELAALVMWSMEDRRQKKLQTVQEMSRLVACTAHDLITPLSGVQLSLSLLHDDPNFLDILRPSHLELLETASSCCKMVTKVCDDLVSSFKFDINTDASDRQAAKSKLNNKRVEGKCNQINITDFVKNIKMVMEPYPKSVPLYVTVGPEVPTAIISDDLKLFRAVINYLTNACNATKKGFVHLRIFVKRNFPARKKQSVIFECQDTGPGVPEEKYSQLFHPVQEDNDNQDSVSCVAVDPDGKLMRRSSVCLRNAPSAGLGLYSVAASISSIGGRYGFFPRSPENYTTENKSEQSEHSSLTGSVFWFSVLLVLPESLESRGKASQAVTVDSAADSQPISESPPSQPVIVPRSDIISKSETTKMEDTISSLLDSKDTTHTCALERFPGTLANDGDAWNGERRPKTALVIDDSLVIRKSLCRALVNSGFVVSEAKDGLEGLKKLQSDVYNVVLCDFLMPVMDGLDCVQQYRSWEKSHRPWFHQYIIGISAHATERDSERGIECGMDTFLPKPVTLNTIKQLVHDDKIIQASKFLDEVSEKNSTFKKFEKMSVLSDSETGPFCLIAEASKNISILMSKAAESKGWKAVVVEDGNDALLLLKSRNWNSVFIGDDLPTLAGTRCIEQFRNWEKDNRIAKQKNVVLICNYCIAPPTTLDFGGSCAVFPNGFDGAMSTPIVLKDFYSWLDLATANCENSILLR